MASKSHTFKGVQLHGDGAANSGDYPDICLSLEIKFTRSSSSSKKVTWSVGGVDFQIADKGKGYRFDYPFYADLCVGSSSSWLVSKGWTSGSGWENSCSVHEDFGGEISTTSSSVLVKFTVEGGHCMNNGEYCYGSSGDCTVYSKTVTIPSYSSGSGGGGGGGGSTTTYKVYYDSNRGDSAPEPQTIKPGQSLTLSTTLPTNMINIRYYNYPDGGTVGMSDFTESQNVSRRLHHWQAYYGRTKMHNWLGTCDGEHYVYPRHIVESKNVNYAYPIPYGLDKVSGSAPAIKLTINAGTSIMVYHWLSGKKPDNSKYPYYYMIDPYQFPHEAYDEGDAIVFGTLSNAPYGVWQPTPPPAGSKILLAYESKRYSYSSSDIGPEYQPGDTYDTSGNNGKRDVYMLAVWDSAITTPVPIADRYKKVNFDYNGGTGSPASMMVPCDKRGYYMWDYRRQYIPTNPDHRVYYKPGKQVDISVPRNQYESNPTVFIQTFSGDGETTEFTLEAPCCEVKYLKINGVNQSASGYVIANTQLIFLEPPAAGTDNIEILYDATAVSHYEHFTGDGKGNVFPIDYRCNYIFEVKIDGVAQDLSRCSIEDDGFGIYVGTTPAEGAAIDITYYTYTYRTNTYTGDGTTTTFTTEAVIANITYVKVNGVEQDPSTYTNGERTVTFTTAPASGATIEIRYYMKLIYTDWGKMLLLFAGWASGRLPYDQLPVPVYPEHVFAGWYYDSGFVKPVSIDEGLIIPDTDDQGKLVKEITIYAKWYDIPIRQFSPDGKWHSIDPVVWRFGEDHQWHKVAHVYRFMKDEGEEEGHWEDISGMVT